MFHSVCNNFTLTEKYCQLAMGPTLWDAGIGDNQTI